jgi:uncharacterized protein (DUF488 family)
MIKLYLTGYEGETLEGFLDRVEELKIKAVVDVREIPLSHKNSFSKENLKKSLDKRGVRYYHFQELGSPQKIRKELHSSGDYLTFFKKYRKYISKKKSPLSKLVEIIIEEKALALLCYEKEYELCHRSIVADEIMNINSQIVPIPI